MNNSRAKFIYQLEHFATPPYQNTKHQTSKNGCPIDSTMTIDCIELIAISVALTISHNPWFWCHHFILLGIHYNIHIKTSISHNVETLKHFCPPQITTWYPTRFIFYFHKYGISWRFKNAYEFVNTRALKFSTLYKDLGLFEANKPSWVSALLMYLYMFLCIFNKNILSLSLSLYLSIHG